MHAAYIHLKHVYIWASGVSATIPNFAPIRTVALVAKSFNRVAGAVT